MTMGEVIAIILSTVTAAGSIVAVISFYISRRNDSYKRGENDESIKADIKYMRNSFDDLRLDVKEVARQQSALSERLTRVEESAKQAHKRIDTIEGNLNHKE